MNNDEQVNLKDRSDEMLKLMHQLKHEVKSLSKNELARQFVGLYVQLIQIKKENDDLRAITPNAKFLNDQQTPSAVDGQESPNV